MSTVELVRRPHLDPLDLEEALVAIHDRDELADAEGRQRLERVRRALEAELARILAE